MANPEQPLESGHPSREDMVARIEAELSRRQSKPKAQAAQTPAKIREGVYMLIFEAFLIFMFGGIYGRTVAEAGTTGPRKSSDFWAERLRDVEEVAAGFIRQLDELWHIEAGLFATGILIAFAIRSEKPRRRYFALLVAATMGILSLKLFDAMMGAIH